MSATEICKAFMKGVTLMWRDPLPIEGNDYRITSIEIGEEISVINYNNGMSEAEVFNSEIEPMTFKEFKELTHNSVYTSRGKRINAFFYDFKDYRYKYMVWCNTKFAGKDDLHKMFYNWVIKKEELPWQVNTKVAERDNKRFKIPIVLK